MCEVDSDVPYWNADVDCAALFAKHKGHPGGFDDFLDGCWPYDGEPTGTSLTEMVGKFEPLLWRDRTYNWSFTPGGGNDRALVAPVFEDGVMVDIIAVRAEQMEIWGAVTGRGSILEADTFDECEQFLLWGDGTLPLNKTVLPSLSSAAQICAEDLDHADLLAWLVFEEPEFDKGGEPAAEAAVLHARDVIGIDDERYDVEYLMAQRAKHNAYDELKQKGIICGRYFPTRIGEAG